MPGVAVSLFKRLFFSVWSVYIGSYVCRGQISMSSVFLSITFRNMLWVSRCTWSTTFQLVFPVLGLHKCTAAPALLGGSLTQVLCLFNKHLHSLHHLLSSTYLLLKEAWNKVGKSTWSLLICMYNWNRHLILCSYYVHLKMLFKRGLSRYYVAQATTQIHSNSSTSAFQMFQLHPWVTTVTLFTPHGPHQVCGTGDWTWLYTW